MVRGGWTGRVTEIVFTISGVKYTGLLFVWWLVCEWLDLLGDNMAMRGFVAPGAKFRVPAFPYFSYDRSDYPSCLWFVNTICDHAMWKTPSVYYTENKCPVRITPSVYYTENKCPVPIILQTCSTSCFTTSRGEKYRHDHVSVCLSVCLSVCPLAYLENHSSNFTKYSILVKLLPTAVARSSSDGNANLLCTSGFVDDVMFSYSRANGGRIKDKRVCFVQFARWRHQSDFRQRCLVHRGRSLPPATASG